MPEPVVVVENLSHKYSVQWAVKEVDFKIACKGIYGLVGSNGAGKSTIMNIMCGVLKPTRGNVYINGIDIRKNSVEAKKHIGFLPQKPPLNPELTVEEYLIYSANLRLIPKKNVAEAVDLVLEKCSLSHFRRRLIKNLSGGYQQRVGIAQAIIHEPSLVVFDEPTNGLDPNQIAEIRNLVQEIAKDRTVILSTHILSEVQATCDHIRMVDEGQIVFSGSVNEFDNYIESDSIYVSLLAMPAPEKLLSIEGVVDAEQINGTGYRVKFNDALEVTDRIVEASVSNNWRLNEIRLERSSMDKIFAELSKKKK